MQVERPAPSSSPAFEETTKTKPFSKEIPAATKAVPPEANVQNIARPLNAPVAPPKVAGPPAVPAASIRPVPSKRPKQWRTQLLRCQGYGA